MSDVLYDKVLRNVIFLEARAQGIQQDLISELAKAFGNLEQTIVEATTFTSRRRAERIAREISTTLSRIYREWGETLTEETQKAVAAVIKRESEIFVKEFDVPEDDLYKLPVEALQTITSKSIAGGLLKTWTDKFSARQARAIQSSLAQSLIEGIGSREAATRLRKDGALGLNRRESDVLARTSLLQASNDARELMYESYDKYISAYRYTATLDSRTCPICGPYDGRVRKQRNDLPSVPRHPRCRCVVVPWDKELVEADDTRPAVVQEEVRTVKHRDGSTSTKFRIKNAKQVPIRTTYSEWFAKLSAADQKQILGPTRYKFYAEGKLKLTQFATPNRIKTVKELEKAIDGPISAKTAARAEFRGITPSAYQNLQKSADSLVKEAIEKNKGYEVAALISEETGLDVAPRIYGKKSSVSLTEHIKFIKENPGKYIQVHNHINDVSFSPEDITLISKNAVDGLGKMHVIGHKGLTEYYAEAKGPSTSIGKFFSKSYKDVQKQVASVLAKLRASGGWDAMSITPEDAIEVIYHAHLQRVQTRVVNSYKNYKYKGSWKQSYFDRQKNMADKFISEVKQTGKLPISDIDFLEKFFNQLFNSIEILD